MPDDGQPSTFRMTRRPAATSDAILRAEINERPRPAITAWLIVSFEPTSTATFLDYLEGHGGESDDDCAPDLLASRVFGKPATNDSALSDETENALTNPIIATCDSCQAMLPLL